MKELNYIPWKKFDFPRHEMVDFCFNKMEAFGDRKNWNINYSDYNIESKLLMFLRDNDIKGYKRTFDSFELGECGWEFLVHDDNDSWVVYADYEDFKIQSIRFLKDLTVIKQYRR